MNNFWVGFKNKKGIFLAILALFTVATSLVDNRYQAYADDYQYSKEECEKMGFKYDGIGFNTAAGAGCLIEEVKIVTPDLVDVIDERDGIKEITLVTCEDANAVERIIVKGNLTEIKSYAETPSDILEAFNKPYKQFYE